MSTFNYLTKFLIRKYFQTPETGGNRPVANGTETANPRQNSSQNEQPIEIILGSLGNHAKRVAVQERYEELQRNRREKLAQDLKGKSFLDKIFHRAKHLVTDPLDSLREARTINSDVSQDLNNKITAYHKARLEAIRQQAIAKGAEMMTDQEELFDVVTADENTQEIIRDILRTAFTDVAKKHLGDANLNENTLAKEIVKIAMDYINLFIKNSSGPTKKILKRIEKEGLVSDLEEVITEFLRNRLSSKNNLNEVLIDISEKEQTSHAQGIKELDKFLNRLKIQVATEKRGVKGGDIGTMGNLILSLMLSGGSNKRTFILAGTLGLASSATKRLAITFGLFNPWTASILGGIFGGIRGVQQIKRQQTLAARNQAWGVEGSGEFNRIMISASNLFDQIDDLRTKINSSSNNTQSNQNLDSILNQAREIDSDIRASLDLWKKGKYIIKNDLNATALSKLGIPNNGNLSEGLLYEAMLYKLNADWLELKAKLKTHLENNRTPESGNQDTERTEAIKAHVANIEKVRERIKNLNSEIRTVKRKDFWTLGRGKQILVSIGFGAGGGAFGYWVGEWLRGPNNGAKLPENGGLAKQVPPSNFGSMRTYGPVKGLNSERSVFQNLNINRTQKVFNSEVSDSGDNLPGGDNPESGILPEGPNPEGEGLNPLTEAVTNPEEATANQIVHASATAETPTPDLETLLDNSDWRSKRLDIARFLGQLARDGQEPKLIEILTTNGELDKAKVTALAEALTNADDPKEFETILARFTNNPEGELAKWLSVVDRQYGNSPYGPISDFQQRLLLSGFMQENGMTIPEELQNILDLRQAAEALNTTDNIEKLKGAIQGAIGTEFDPGEWIKARDAIAEALGQISKENPEILILIQGEDGNIDPEKLAGLAEALTRGYKQGDIEGFLKKLANNSNGFFEEELAIVRGKHPKYGPISGEEQGRIRDLFIQGSNSEAASTEQTPGEQPGFPDNGSNNGSNDSQTPEGGSNDSQTPEGGSNGSQTHEGGSNDSQTPEGGSNDSQTPEGGSNDSQTPEGGSNGSQTHEGGSSNRVPLSDWLRSRHTYFTETSQSAPEVSILELEPTIPQGEYITLNLEGLTQDQINSLLEKQIPILHIDSSQIIGETQIEETTINNLNTIAGQIEDRRIVLAIEPSGHLEAIQAINTLRESIGDTTPNLKQAVQEGDIVFAFVQQASNGEIAIVDPQSHINVDTLFEAFGQLPEEKGWWGFWGTDMQTGPYKLKKNIGALDPVGSNVNFNGSLKGEELLIAFPNGTQKSFSELLRISLTKRMDEIAKKANAVITDNSIFDSSGTIDPNKLNNFIKELVLENRKVNPGKLAILSDTDLSLLVALIAKAQDNVKIDDILNNVSETDSRQAIAAVLEEVKGREDMPPWAKIIVRVGGVGGVGAGVGVGRVLFRALNRLRNRTQRGLGPQPPETLEIQRIQGEASNTINGFVQELRNNTLSGFRQTLEGDWRTIQQVLPQISQGQSPINTIIQNISSSVANAESDPNIDLSQEISAELRELSEIVYRITDLLESRHGWNSDPQSHDENITAVFRAILFGAYETERGLQIRSVEDGLNDLENNLNGNNPINLNQVGENNVTIINQLILNDNVTLTQSERDFWNHQTNQQNWNHQTNQQNLNPQGIIRDLRDGNNIENFRSIVAKIVAYLERYHQPNRWDSNAHLRNLETVAKVLAYMVQEIQRIQGEAPALIAGLAKELRNNHPSDRLRQDWKTIESLLSQESQKPNTTLPTLTEIRNLSGPIGAIITVAARNPNIDLSQPTELTKLLRQQSTELRQLTALAEEIANALENQPNGWNKTEHSNNVLAVLRAIWFEAARKWEESGLGSIVTGLREFQEMQASGQFTEDVIQNHQIVDSLIKNKKAEFTPKEQQILEQLNPDSLKPSLENLDTIKALMNIIDKIAGILEKETSYAWDSNQHSNNLIAVTKALAYGIYMSQPATPPTPIESSEAEQPVPQNTPEPETTPIEIIEASTPNAAIEITGRNKIGSYREHGVPVMSYYADVGYGKPRQEDRVVFGSKEIEMGGQKVTARLMCVIDGMGGHFGGDIIARAFAEALQTTFAKYAFDPNNNLENQVKLLIEQARQSTLNDPEIQNFISMKLKPSPGFVLAGAIGFEDGTGKTVIYPFSAGDCVGLIISPEQAKKITEIEGHLENVYNCFLLENQQIQGVLGTYPPTELQPTDVVIFATDGYADNRWLSETDTLDPRTYKFIKDHVNTEGGFSSYINITKNIPAVARRQIEGSLGDQWANGNYDSDSIARALLGQLLSLYEAGPVTKSGLKPDNVSFIVYKPPVKSPETPKPAITTTPTNAEGAPESQAPESGIESESVLKIVNRFAEDLNNMNESDVDVLTKDWRTISIRLLAEERKEFVRNATIILILTKSNQLQADKASAALSTLGSLAENIAKKLETDGVWSSEAHKTNVEAIIRASLYTVEEVIRGLREIQRRERNIGLGNAISIPEMPIIEKIQSLIRENTSLREKLLKFITNIKSLRTPLEEINLENLAEILELYQLTFSIAQLLQASQQSGQATPKTIAMALAQPQWLEDILEIKNQPSTKSTEK